MNTARRISLLPGLLAASALLSACVESPSRLSSGGSVAQQAAKAFSSTCLESLPGFDRFQTNARAASLIPSENLGNIHTVYVVPNSKVFVGLQNLPGASDVEVCGVRAVSSEPSSVVGDAILNAARSSVGSGTEKEFPSERFEYAIQLPNGSLLTHDAKDMGSTTSNVFLISQPVPQGRVPSLIFDG